MPYHWYIPLTTHCESIIVLTGVAKINPSFPIFCYGNYSRIYDRIIASYLFSSSAFLLVSVMKYPYIDNCLLTGLVACQAYANLVLAFASCSVFLKFTRREADMFEFRLIKVSDKKWVCLPWTKMIFLLYKKTMHYFTEMNTGFRRKKLVCFKLWLAVYYVFVYIFTYLLKYRNKIPQFISITIDRSFHMETILII